MKKKIDTDCLEVLIGFVGCIMIFSEDCRGAIIPFRYDNHDFELVLPGSKRSDDRYAVTKFSNAKVRSFRAQISRNHSGGLMEVEFGGLFFGDTFIIRTDCVIDGKDTNAILGKLQAWAYKFIDYLEIVLCDTVASYSPASSQDYNHAYATPLITRHALVSDSKNEVLQPTVLISPKSITVSSLAAERADIEVALKLVSDKNSKVITATETLTYRLLADTQRHYLFKNNRYAVIDAVTVIELVLVTLLDKELAKLDDDGATKCKLKNSEKTLINLCESLKTLKMEDRPLRRQACKVAELRNKTVHKGYDPTPEETKEAVAFTKKTVKKYMPMPWHTKK